MSGSNLRLVRLEIPRDSQILLHFHDLYDKEYKFDRKQGEYDILVDFLAKHADIYHCLVLYEGGTPVGYMRLYDRISTSSCDTVMMLDIVYIAPEYRGRGLGKNMVAELVEYAKKTGAARIDLLADVGNEVARKVYSDHDFRGRIRFQMHRFLKEQADLKAYFEKKVGEEAGEAGPKCDGGA